MRTSCDGRVGRRLAWLQWSDAVRGAGPRPARLTNAAIRAEPAATIRAGSSPACAKSLLKLTFVPRWLTSADFRLAFDSGTSANKVCIEGELLDRFRMVFERR